MNNKIRIVHWHEEDAHLFFVQRKLSILTWVTFACGNQEAAVEIAQRENKKL